LNVPDPPRDLLVRHGIANAADLHALVPARLRHIVHHGGLRPDGSVLDVGSGCGPAAMAVLSHLAPEGVYEGVDVGAEAVRWCSENIGALRSNFRFRGIDVANGFYNPSGAVAPEAAVFPFDDRSFDVVYLASVFTHMLEPGVRRYLSETRRVLRPGGRCVATFFLLDPFSLEGLGSGRIGLPFRHEFGPHAKVYDPKTPEMAIAYDEERVLEMIAAAGLSVNLVRKGSWSGHPDHEEFQDLVVMVKDDPVP
jgi:SAM-dependent methyltransferase